MKLAFKLMEDAGIPQDRAKPEGRELTNIDVLCIQPYLSLKLSCPIVRDCPQGPEEHTESTVRYLWQVQDSFPAAATPTDHTHHPWSYFSCVNFDQTV